MDRNSLIGMILIGVVVAVWVFFQSSTTRDVTPEQTAKKTEQRDSVRAAVAPPAKQTAAMTAFRGADERIITVETEKTIVRLSSAGGTIVSWKLKDYRPWYHLQQPSAIVDLIHPGTREFGFDFRAVDGSKIEARNVAFTWVDAPASTVLTGSKTLTVRAVARTENGGTIERAYTFTGSDYAVKHTLTLTNLDSLIPYTNRAVTLTWRKGLRYQEQNSVEESNQSVGVAAIGGSVEEMDVSSFNAEETQTYGGKLDYIGSRSKYFAVALKPDNFDGSAFLTGIKYGAANEGIEEQYGFRIRYPYGGGTQSYTSQLYVGPMQYDVMQSLGLTGMMNFGLKWIVKPIGEYFMLPTLRFLQSLVTNWGVAIIIFGVFMKILLYPLSIQQMRSAQKMKLIAPLLANVREKYKDDMQTQQQETMKVYSQYGINPAGGCLPLLLQMPFLYALYAVLNLNVELRQAAFLNVWLTDLSVPDVIFSLPFKVPLFNVDQFSGLAVVMGITMFIQQKMSVTDPRQQAMLYMMPVMFTLIFSSLPSGLNLYYFVFNILSIGQQVYINNYSRNRMTLEDLKKAPKKESWLQKKMREAQEVAAQQQRPVQGKKRQ
jgi:YidC/Oxa1 family membrane protein insertase